MRYKWQVILGKAVVFLIGMTFGLGVLYFLTVVFLGTLVGP